MPHKRRNSESGLMSKPDGARGGQILQARSPLWQTRERVAERGAGELYAQSPGWPDSRRLPRTDQRWFLEIFQNLYPKYSWFRCPTQAPLLSVWALESAHVEGHPG